MQLLPSLSFNSDSIKFADASLAVIPQDRSDDATGMLVSEIPVCSYLSVLNMGESMARQGEFHKVSSRMMYEHYQFHVLHNGVLAAPSTWLQGAFGTRLPLTLPLQSFSSSLQPFDVFSTESMGSPASESQGL